MKKMFATKTTENNPSAQLNKTLGVRSLCISPLFNELHMFANCWVIRIWDFINKKKGTLAISTTLPCVLGCIAKYQHCNSMLCTMYTSYNLCKMTAVEMKMICKCLHSKSPWRTLETKYLKIGMKTREGMSMKSPVFWTRTESGHWLDRSRPDLRSVYLLMWFVKIF